MNNFYKKHGQAVVNGILKGAPIDASHFVYAYVAKSTDYLKYDGDTTLVWYRGQWKVITAQFIIDSFKDMVNSLADLKEVNACHQMVDMYGGVAGAEGRLAYFDWMPHRNAEYQQLSRAIGVVTGKIDPFTSLKVAS